MSAGQAGANLGGSEEFQRAARQYEQIAHCLNDTLPLEGLSLLEAYINGPLRIVIPLEAGAVHAEQVLHLVIHGNEAAAANFGSVWQGDHVAAQIDFAARRDEHLMLVGDVELVKTVKAVTLPTFVGLYDVNDAIADSSGRPLLRTYLSVDGSRHRLRVPVEGEMCVGIDSMARVLNEQTVCVVEGGAEVMNCIAEHCGRVAREPGAELNGFGPIVFVGLGLNSLSVLAHVFPEQSFELRDVMFGPFSL